MSAGAVKVIGLAGGVAAGKTTVARMFEDLGARVIDADQLGHEVLRDADVKARLRERWGARALNASGEADRKAIGDIVFGAPAEAEFLNALTHPRILARVRERIAAWRAGGDAPLIVLDAPLIYEKGRERWCDAMVFVEAPRSTRGTRAVEQRGWAPTELDRREAAQMAPEEKKLRARLRIDNGGALTETRRQVREVFDRLVSDEVRDRSEIQCSEE